MLLTPSRKDLSSFQKNATVTFSLKSKTAILMTQISARKIQDAVQNRDAVVPEVRKDHLGVAVWKGHVGQRAQMDHLDRPGNAECEEIRENAVLTELPDVLVIAVRKEQLDDMVCQEHLERRAQLVHPVWPVAQVRLVPEENPVSLDPLVALAVKAPGDPVVHQARRDKLENPVIPEPVSKIPNTTVFSS